MTETRILPVSSRAPDPDVIAQAAGVLRQGGLVAFPTETVYGLGADVLSADAVRKVFSVKGRPPDNPLIVHVAGTKMLDDVVDEIPDKGKMLGEAFWPGPLTLVMKRTILVSDLVTAGLDTVAVRMPDHPVALALIRAFGEGIVGPSANLSGKPSPTTAQHVYDDLRGQIELILDAGQTTIGVESTVVDVTVDPPVILRLGGLTRERIEEVIGPVETDTTGERSKRSPGSRHRHYAPKAKVLLVRQDDQAAFAAILQEQRQAGKQVGCIVHSALLAKLESGESYRVLPSSIDIFARYLFRTLRELDAMHVDVIVIEGVHEDGLGATVMDRLRRAEQG
ncbi:MAG: L-threonylcarbamoyladenylate synthase [Ignavibacteriales bacterium]|nr:L-threonylcarbamoyladenylate synthase [Ignavibacteriales bacterium]